MKKITVISVLSLFFSLYFINGASALTFSPVMREYSLSPGQSITEKIKLLNETNQPLVFYAAFQDFGVQDESGTPKILPEGALAESGSLSQWFSPLSPIVINPKETKEVEVVIQVPTDAEPGGHYGAVLFYDSKGEAADSVGVAAKSGPIFLVNVLGDIKEDFKLLTFETDKGLYYNLPATFNLRMENKGTVHETPMGAIKLQGWLGEKIVEFNAKGTAHVLPNSIRKISLDSGEIRAEPGFFAQARSQFANRAIGRYQADLSLRYGLTIDGATGASLVFWVFPWQLLSLVVGLLLLIFIILKLYNRTIIKQANRAHNRLQNQEAERKTVAKQPTRTRKSKKDD
jgi:hypothetical protein